MVWLKDINLLHPNIREKCLQLIELSKKAGINIIITHTLRTKQEQDDLYAQGRTKPGNIVTNCKYPDSPHNWGVAFDFAVIKNGKADWNDISAFNKVGQLGKSIGLFWGGDFKSFVDKPHFEDPILVKNNSVKWLKSIYNTPNEFIESYQKLDKESDDALEVNVFGKDIELKNVVFKDNLNYVNLRELFSQLNCKVDWDKETNKTFITLK